MSKYIIYHETGWDEDKQQMSYKQLISTKNEKEAIRFINNINNIGTHGNMIIKQKVNGEVMVYNAETDSWTRE